MSSYTACSYMPHPEHSLRGRIEKLFRSLAYSIWRREIRAFMSRGQTRRLRIVDVGCGPGLLLGCLHDWFPGAELTGIDASDELLGILKSRCKAATGLKGDACSLSLPNGSADILFAMHVVEHLQEPGQFLAGAHWALRTGGLIIIATPNARGLGARIMKKSWKGYSDPTHIALHGPSYWSHALEIAGFEIVRDGTTGLSGLPAFNRMPLGLLHWIPSFFFGFYPWKLGEAYVCIAVRRA